MKGLVVLLLALLPAAAGASPQELLDYTLFDSWRMPGGYYFSHIESDSPSWVENLGGRIPCRPMPSWTRGGALELHYVSRPSGSWGATLQRRPIRGQDEWDNGVYVAKRSSPFKRPEVLHFRICPGSTPPGALPRIALLLSGRKTSLPVNLGPYLSPADMNGWSRVRIPLADFPGTSIAIAEEVAGVVWEQGEADTLEHRVYVDQVDLRPANDPPLPAGLRPELLSAKGYELHIDLAWTPSKDPAVRGMLLERSRDGITFTPVGLSARHLNRYTDFVGEAGATYQYRIRLQGYDGTVSEASKVLSAATHAMTDEELLDMVQEACLRYYWDGAEEESGMALECIPGDRHMVAVGASGFGLMALVVGVERGFIPRTEAIQRFTKIVGFLERADRFHGVMPHYYQGSNGHPQLFFGPDDNGGDLVETSFLFQGLLTVRQYLREDDPVERSLRQRITHLWEGVEWSWHRTTPDFPYLLWHWSPDKGWKIHHRLIGWNEVMITYLLAIASPKHPVPSDMYYSGWASQAKEAQDYRGDSDGKMYTNGNIYHGICLAVGGFTGGPLFFTHYSYLGMDPRNLRDRFTDYYENNRAIATINLRYCQENPLKHRGYGDGGWGLTASDGPWGYSPDEPRPEGDKGKLAPTGAIASFPYLPEAAMTALKTYYRGYGAWLWGEYGFRDAFNLDDSWVNDLWMGLNQAPMVVMIENHRTGLLWKLFMSNPEIQAMKSQVFHN